MNAENFYALDRWVKHFANGLSSGEMALTRWASKASEELKCRVSVDSIKAAMSANGIKVKAKKATRKSGESLSDRVKTLEKRVDVLMEALFSDKEPVSCCDKV